MFDSGAEKNMFSTWSHALMHSPTSKTRNDRQSKVLLVMVSVVTCRLHSISAGSWVIQNLEWLIAINKCLFQSDKVDFELKTGYLTKKGAVVKNWKRRYFVVFPDFSVEYYENEEVHFVVNM